MTRRLSAQVKSSETEKPEQSFLTRQLKRLSGQHKAQTSGKATKKSQDKRPAGKASRTAAEEKGAIDAWNREHSWSNQIGLS